MNPKFRGKKAVILGVSPDGEKSHQKFKEKYNLPFQLLVDTDHSISQKFGVWGEKINYGRKYMGMIRSHFVIGEDGRIVDARVNVKAVDSPDLALEALGGGAAKKNVTVKKKAVKKTVRKKVAAKKTAKKRSARKKTARSR